MVLAVSHLHGSFRFSSQQVLRDKLSYPSQLEDDEVGLLAAIL
jgi:hypothetical protein